VESGAELSRPSRRFSSASQQIGTSAREPTLSKQTYRGQSGRRRSELERLLDRTLLEPTHPELGTCWRFTGIATPYGRIAKAQDSYTHRLGWKLLRGPIPEGKELHHRCGVYACWNPDHLELVTHAENQRHLRKTQCSQGHPLSGANLRINPNGTRTCRACNAANQRAFRERQRVRQDP
jgi:HNH endonuclease